MIDNWRWQGVPFYLRAGKRLPGRLTECAIHFRRIPLCLFGHEEACSNLQPNVLRIRIQPEEEIKLSFVCKTPGGKIESTPVVMDFNYEKAFGQKAPDAYERLILDAVRGDTTLFARNDEVEAAWSYITPLLETFAKRKPASYKPGSDGPIEARELISDGGRVWDDIG